MWFLNFLACGAGIGSGLVATQLSLAASRRLRDDSLWQRLGGFLRLLLSPEEGDRLLQEYVRLWPVLLVFAAKKLALGLISLAPVALVFGCFELGLGLYEERRPTYGHGMLAWLDVRDWELHFFTAVGPASVVGWLAARFKA